MKPKSIAQLLLVALALTFLPTAHADEAIQIKPDVVYGHKMGMALTYDVLKPKEPNGAAAVFMVSGGWVSRWAPPGQFAEKVMAAKETNGWGMLLDRGFTLFLVRHGSSPLFKVPDAVADVRRSIRTIRANAEKHGIDPDSIGVFGGSAGGHLSLMLGTASDAGDPDAKDPIDRVSNRVAAVVAYFPPTELENYVGDERFPALQFDKDDSASVSPIRHVTADDPPTLLLHGAKDELVTLDHSEKIKAKFAEAGVQTELVVFPDAGHGFGGADEKKASEALVGWFEEHLTLKGRLTGTWDAMGESPDGQERGSTVVITQKDGKLHAVATSDNGEFAVDSVTIFGKSVVFEKKEAGAVIKVEAAETKPGHLEGKWSMEIEGDEPIGGKWRAKRRK